MLSVIVVIFLGFWLLMVISILRVWIFDIVVEFDFEFMIL